MVPWYQASAPGRTTVSTETVAHSDLPLPVPAAAALSHSERVAGHVRCCIEEAGGALPFDRYMETVLYQPQLGYYAAGLHKFGQAGDFVTAPELGMLFGRCLARQCAQVLDTLTGGTLLEFGAGSGALAETLITELAALDALPAEYLVVEVSAELRDRQQQRLSTLCARHGVALRWLEQLPAVPVEGVILANEVVDAFPVTRFRLVDGKVLRAAVCCDGTAFKWDWLDDLDANGMEAQCAARYNLPEGYTSETSPRGAAWVKALAACLRQGVLLVIDYGYPAAEYYLPERTMGTLRCHYQHHAHDDPLLYPGLQDITSHVDFSALARAGQVAGLTLLGYASQEAFLLSLGLLELVPQGKDERTRLAAAREVKVLTMPTEMGELCKVLALGRGIGEPLVGFALSDRTHSL